MSQAASKQPPPVHLSVRLELPGKPAKEFSYDFRQPTISLGRDPTNDIQIPLTTVSRNHARIFFEHGSFFLEDLGSTHGTAHNGRRLDRGEKRLLRDGDELSVMSFRVHFKTVAGTPLDRQPGERTEQLARRMVQEVLSSLGGAGREPPALRVMNGADEGKRFEIAEEAMELTIGRSPECDICLDDPNSSRRHCLIKRNWHGFTAQDLGSKNGVLVNGKVIEGPTLIKDGDELLIGGVKLIFVDPPSRLLDQMGGLDQTAMDPEGVADTGGDAEAPEGAFAEPEAGEPEPASGGAWGAPPAEDPASASALAAADEEGEAGEEGEEAPEGPAPAPQPQARGFPVEMIILVAGGLFLLGSVGLIAFLFL
jgi:pSer/pThr/pTyr-binding forkhead associated (FHA) protein